MLSVLFRENNVTSRIWLCKGHCNVTFRGKDINKIKKKKALSDQKAHRIIYGRLINCYSWKCIKIIGNGFKLPVVDMGIRGLPFESDINRFPGLVVHVWLCLFMFEYGHI